jgi:hypothetical protein
MTGRHQPRIPRRLCSAECCRSCFWVLSHLTVASNPETAPLQAKTRSLRGLTLPATVWNQIERSFADGGHLTTRSCCPELLGES